MNPADWENQKYTQRELTHCSNCGGELVPGYFAKHKDPNHSCNDGRNKQQFDAAVREGEEAMRYFSRPSELPEELVINNVKYKKV